jgi:glycine/D-amino acid oxidase-like deaminating enzyme
MGPELERTEMKQRVYWTDLTPRPENLPVRGLPERVELAVVGGGYCGLSAARTLAKQGAQVAVLEAHEVGWGASSRNGGFYGTGLIVPPSRLVARYGEESACALWNWAQASRDFTVGLIQEERIDCDLEARGLLALAYKRSHLADMEESASSGARWTGRPKARILRAGELTEQIGSEAFHGAVVQEDGGVLDPAKYVFGLAHAAASAGAQLVEGARVEGIERGNGGYYLHTSLGRLRASEVLLATNGYTGRVAGGVRLGIIHGACYTIVTEPLHEDLQRSVSPDGRSFYDSRMLLSYFRLTPDGRVLFGGSDSLTPDLDLESRARNLRRRMLEFFPQLRGAEISHVWTGQLGMTFDQMPHIGREDGVHYAYGFNGHGVTIATYMGHEVAMLIAGLSSGSLFQQIGHPRYFFAPLEGIYMPVVSAGLRVLDRLS